MSQEHVIFRSPVAVQDLTGTGSECCQVPEMGRLAKRMSLVCGQVCTI